jgi:hypothetical protein
VKTSELISPAISPVPNVTSTSIPTFFQVDDFSLLNEAWVLQDSSLHKAEFTHKFALPVSKITGISCPGVPIEISPIYWVFLKFFKGIILVLVSSLDEDRPWRKIVFCLFWTVPIEP